MKMQHARECYRDQRKCKGETEPGPCCETTFIESQSSQVCVSCYRFRAAHHRSCARQLERFEVHTMCKHKANNRNTPLPIDAWVPKAYLAGASAIIIIGKRKLPKDWVQVGYEKPAACTAIVMRERGRAGRLGEGDERGMAAGYYNGSGGTVGKGSVTRCVDGAIRGGARRA